MSYKNKLTKEVSLISHKQTNYLVIGVKGFLFQICP